MTFSIWFRRNTLISPKQLRLPASVEFITRCGLVASRRFGRRSSATVSPPTGLQRNPATPAELVASLDSLGIKPGDDLLVHSNTGSVESLGWTPSGMIDFLLDYLGSSGTLLMPSHPKLHEDGEKRTYKVLRSPSTVGMMTELFRRRTEVVRSRFPFSAAAGLGARAHEYLDDHVNSFAPHDHHSPYAKLAAAGGKSLCIGCDLDRSTVLHVAEDTVRDHLKIDGFHQPQSVRVVHGDAERTVVAHTRAPWLWWYLNLSRWTSEMYRHKIAKDTSINGITLRTSSAQRMVSYMQYEIKAGRSLYPLAKVNRWLKLQEPQLEAA
jgi:aminoglycoside 3-N-acetyltransferase